MPPYRLLSGKRLDTNLLRNRIRKYPDSPIHMLSVSWRTYFFSTLESGFKNIQIRCRICRMRVDGSRIRKEKVAVLKLSGYVWTGPKYTTKFSSNNSKIAAKIQMGLLKLVYSEQRSKYKLHTPKNSKSKRK